MSTRKRLLCIGSLIFGGVFSLLLSLFGGIGLLGVGFPTKGHVEGLAFFFPFLAMFPLFILSLGLTRAAPFLMWLLVPTHWLVLVSLSMASFTGGAFAFIKLLSLCLFQNTVCALLFAASLVLYGIQIFKSFLFDDFFFHWLGGKFGVNE